MAKYDLYFTPPLINAAGALGYSPPIDGQAAGIHLGAFLTNPVSLAQRTPARWPRYMPYAGGFLLHTGHPNPGLGTVIRRYAARWRRSSLPVIVHLLAHSAEEAAGMARRLEMVGCVAGIELGLPADIPAPAAAALVAACQGELPVMVRLPLERVTDLAQIVLAAGAAAISLGPPRGTLALPDAELVQGRLYGPAVFPLALAAVRNLAREGFPVVGAGGVYSQQDANAMLSAGALAVQLDSVFWRGGWTE